MRAVFLDRDGVLVQDVHRLTRPEQIVFLPGVPGALRRLADEGFGLVVVTNQPVVARGLIDEAGIEAIHAEMERRLRAVGAPGIAQWSFCPHHPHAELPAYREACRCRKPLPGMLVDASQALGVDRSRSFMVGDRMSDVAAGAAAGCRTIQVTTGEHAAPPIVSHTPIPDHLEPDAVVVDLSAAVDWILEQA